MSKSIDNTQFMEWVEQYVNDTISPEAAEQLLSCVQQDPEKLEMLSSQLQTDRLLEIMNKQNQMNSIAEVVLERAKKMPASKDLKKLRRSKVLLKIAASLVILIGIGYIGIPAQCGISDRSKKTKHKARMDEKPLLAKEINATREQKKVIGLKQDKGYLAETAPVKSKKPAPSTENFQWTATTASSMQPNFKDISGNLGRGTLMDECIPRQEASENYAEIVENKIHNTRDKMLSTFSFDVDTASYANIRRFLNQNTRPPQDAVRIEEMINYFEYTYDTPKGNDPFATSMALADCPWNNNHQLLRIGLQGRNIDIDQRKNSNLVFLFDVSGSMNSPDKLPLLKRGFEKMVRNLGEKDRVAIVVYAGSSGVVLNSTSATNKETIIDAMNRLKAGGSTAGGQGIELAYKLASDHFIKNGVNRVILATDGDFNVGVSTIDALQKLIEEKRNTGVFLSVLGFGTGNLQDAKMEVLANKGNGNYFYIDSERETEKVLVKQLTANLVTIAKDVKIQVEFNPALVRSYRLIGYENRIMAARDFNDDTKDAGEIGAGHQVTALYELVPTDAPATEDGVSLKYAKTTDSQIAPETASELLTVKLRYKQPEESTSQQLTFALSKSAYRPDAMDESFRWATAIAAFGMHLRNSNQIQSFSMQQVLEMASRAIGEDPNGYRKESIKLMNRAMRLKSEDSSTDEYPQWKFRN